MEKEKAMAAGSLNKRCCPHINDLQVALSLLAGLGGE
jgi:hypothetical protein